MSAETVIGPLIEEKNRFKENEKIMIEESFELNKE